MHILRRGSGSNLSPSVCANTGVVSDILAANRTAELELDEEATRIALTIVDTPGFGDQIDNEAR